MVIKLLLGVLFLHWVGDFIFQTRQMARNKSTSIKWLTYHVLAYTFTFAGVLGLFCLYLEFLTPFKVSNPMLKDMAGFVIFNAVAHWVVDFITSKLTTYYYKNGYEKGFYTTLGFDQLLHCTFLLLSFQHYFLMQ